MRRIFMGLLLLLALAGQADAACTVPRWRFIWDIETDGYMQSDGGRCRMDLIWTSGKTEVHSVTVTLLPHHGSASVSGLHVFYTPAKGFVALRFFFKNVQHLAVGAVADGVYAAL